MTLGIEEASALIADNPGISDREIYKLLEQTEREISARLQARSPVPIDLLKARRVLIVAKEKRRGQVTC